VEACLKVGFETLVNTGSSSEYGFKEHAPSEQEWLDPNSYYAVMKAAGTMFCRFIARRDNVPIPTLRLYSVYGPYEEPQRLIPALVVNGLRGQLPPLVNPNVARDFVYVDDVCGAYLLAATQQKADSGAIYNVGSGIQTSLSKIVDIARQLFSIESIPEWGSMPSRDWDTTAWVANIDYIQQSLRWQPRTSLRDGLSHTASWLQSHPDLHRFYQEQLLS
jgi:dolichol-phosphate mannosyltransferase